MRLLKYFVLFIPVLIIGFVIYLYSSVFLLDIGIVERMKKGVDAVVETAYTNNVFGFKNIYETRNAGRPYFPARVMFDKKVGPNSYYSYYAIVDAWNLKDGWLDVTDLSGKSRRILMDKGTTVFSGGVDGKELTSVNEKDRIGILQGQAGGLFCQNDLILIYGESPSRLRFDANILGVIWLKIIYRPECV